MTLILPSLNSGNTAETSIMVHTTPEELREIAARLELAAKNAPVGHTARLNVENGLTFVFRSHDQSRGMIL